MTDCKTEFVKCLNQNVHSTCDWRWKQCRIWPLVQLSYSRYECLEHMYALRRNLLAKAADRVDEERAVDIAREGIEQCHKRIFIPGPDAAALYPNSQK